MHSKELAASAGPIAGAERIDAVDTLRGVAVLGILVMNIYAFSMPFAAYGNPLRMGGTGWLDLGTWYLTHVLFDQKFMTIFSLLYGGGLVILWQRAEARGLQPGRLVLRRQFWLLVIGAAHAYLIWFGDILFSYAVIGMLVYPLRRLSPVRLAVLAVLMMSVAPWVTWDLGRSLEALPEGEILLQDADALKDDLVAHRGTYADIFGFRASQVAWLQIEGILFFGLWRTGGLMLLGMALMKLGVLSGRREAAFYRKMLAAGYGIGLPLMAVSVHVLTRAGWDEVFVFRIGSLPNYLGSLFVAAGHTAAVMLIVKSGWRQALMSRFTAVGRMALTNYLMHSVVMTTIFYGYGLGLYGTVPRSAQMLFVAGMLGFQLWLSPLWLTVFRFGPAEWAWRSLTYGRLQPLRYPD